MSTFAAQYLAETAQIAAALDVDAIERLVDALVAVHHRRGRLFCLGLGGGAAYAAHAAHDFRHLAGLDAYAPTEATVSMTAYANDAGWDQMIVAWLRNHWLSWEDALFVFSVGGGTRDPGLSLPIVAALMAARDGGVTILGIVGRDGGETAAWATACVIVPPVVPARVTAHTEGLQAVIWHLLVSHPKLKIADPKWESLGTGYDRHS